jgi:hypothetical protein
MNAKRKVNRNENKADSRDFRLQLHQGCSKSWDFRHNRHFQTGIEACASEEQLERAPDRARSNRAFSGAAWLIERNLAF